MIRVAINGYGRIGRVVHRVLMEHYQEEICIVGINAGASTTLEGWMYLLKYDTNYGSFAYPLSVTPNADVTQQSLLGSLHTGSVSIPIYSQKNPALLPWKQLDVDVVIESTGKFLTKEQCEAHIQAGAKTVVIAAPAQDDTPTYVMGINSGDYKGEKIVSNASCTTNCITPVAYILQNHFGIEKAMMTTIHAYTSDQRLQDGGHKDLRRARSAGQNIIPTSTGATTAMTKVLPDLTNLFTGLAVRVPVSGGSLCDFTFVLKKEVTVKDINTLFENEAKNPVYNNLFTVTTEPLVSHDILGTRYASIIDLSLTQVVGGNLVKVVSWYDNEYGYATQLIKEAIMIGKSVKHI